MKNLRKNLNSGSLTMFILFLFTLLIDSFYIACYIYYKLNPSDLFWFLINIISGFICLFTSIMWYGGKLFKPIFENYSPSYVYTGNYKTEWLPSDSLRGNKRHKELWLEVKTKYNKTKFIQMKYFSFDCIAGIRYENVAWFELQGLDFTIRYYNVFLRNKKITEIIPEKLFNHINKIKWDF